MCSEHVGKGAPERDVAPATSLPRAPERDVAPATSLPRAPERDVAPASSHTTLRKGRLTELLVGSQQDGLRLDVFLAKAGLMLTRSACARLIERGAVTINATIASDKSEHVVLGDRIAVELPELQHLERKGPLRPNPHIPLDIRFEDAWLIVLSKQAGLVCHPSPGHVDDTLANALVAYCGYDHLGMLQGPDRPGIVHRLDRDTSGLLLAAKDDATQRALQDLIRLRVLERRYVTLVAGSIVQDDGQIITGIARSKHDRTRMAVSLAPGAREAITTWRVLERYEAGRRDTGYTLLECHLYTGRTHQIRVHMRHIGHPVIGDQLYGRGDDRQNLGLRRQFLHSWYIAFDHPVTGEHITCSDFLPRDLVGVIDDLRQRSLGRTATGDEVCSRLGI